ncbi:hypothetical protein GUJ93_ZPchr0001g31934 [Zizania palustris]|uniref:Uncharacterized protein n=1 Tax=Zizania palustris TaxID=103762 RepID=A0A8J5RX43_ZIZPA|nr:hypothetical protein GUJ93_ZPchr0001g31934 [Zizania palustris]
MVMTVDEKLDFLMVLLNQIMGQLSMINARLNDHDHRLTLIKKEIDRASNGVVVLTNESIEDKDVKVLPLLENPDDGGNHGSKSGREGTLRPTRVDPSQAADSTWYSRVLGQ